MDASELPVGSGKDVFSFPLKFENCKGSVFYGQVDTESNSINGTELRYIHRRWTEQIAGLGFVFTVYRCGSNFPNTNRTQLSKFEILLNANRTRVLFGSVRCGAELEQTERDLGNVLFGLFVRLAISAYVYRLVSCRIDLFCSRCERERERHQKPPSESELLGPQNASGSNRPGSAADGWL